MLFSIPLLCKDGNFFRRGKSWEVEALAGTTNPGALSCRAEGAMVR